MAPDPLVTTFNNNIQTMAQARSGATIVMVDQQGALVPGDMNDNLRPKQVGYAKMADEWLNALTALLQKCP